MSSIQFCPECNNMLYPKENKKDKKLFKACRNCDYEVDAAEGCASLEEANTVNLNKIHKEAV